VTNVGEVVRLLAESHLEAIAELEAIREERERTGLR
jgi:hypothetical protein